MIYDTAIVDDTCHIQCVLHQTLMKTGKLEDITQQLS